MCRRVALIVVAFLTLVGSSALGQTGASSGATGVSASTASTGLTVQQNNTLPPSALGDSSIYEKSLSSLTLAFVIAVLLENAFALIFSWRVFLTYFSLGGMKTVVMIVVSWIVVSTFQIDVLADLIGAYRKKPVESVWFSRMITALILAGGSSGVNNIMLALGFRSLRSDKVEPKPPANKAWIAIRVARKNSVGPVQVSITEIEPAPNPMPPTLAGIAGMRRPGLFELLLGNPNRFPSNGGHTVEPGKPYRISASADSKQTPGTRVSQANGDYVFAPGAIVDFNVAL